MTWGNTKVKSSSDTYLKVAEYNPSEIRILDAEPHIKLAHQSEEGIAPCLGDSCAACSDGEIPTERYVANVYSHTQGRVLIYEFGGMVMKKIKAIAQSLEKRNKSITEIDLEISASGSGKGTKYEVVPVMDTPRIIPEGIKRFDLERKPT